MSKLTAEELKEQFSQYMRNNISMDGVILNTGLNLHYKKRTDGEMAESSIRGLVSDFLENHDEVSRTPELVTEVCELIQGYKFQ